MKNKRMHAAVALTAIGALALTACSGESNDTSSSAPASTSSNKFTIAYNGDGGHQAWVDAVANSIKNTLGIQAEGQPYATFAELRQDVQDRKMTGAFRTGWQADYPSLYNFLGPLYGTGAGSNDGDYSNENFDNLLRQGLTAGSVEEANGFFDQAQEQLFTDLPVIPLWYSNVTGGYSENVSDVEFGWNSQPIYSAVKKDGGDGIVIANGSEPANPLVPGMTNETGGGRIMDQIFQGLVSYKADGSPQNELAESIESEDSQLWTIKIKPGHKFQNGEEVTAKSFVDAWNYGALLSNAQLSSYFFESIEGFSYDEDSELALDIVDDHTFTVKLAQPEADFPLRLGYTAFMPLPSVAFEDMEAYGQAPIANGPYIVKEGSWKHDTSIDLVPNPDYDGPRTAANKGIRFVFYTSQDTAYTDLLANNLDVLDAVPDSAFATFETDLNGRSVNQASAVFQSFTIPEKLEHFSGEEGILRRQAISMAIDRTAITDAIFQGTRTPAKDFTSPVIAGWNDSLKGSEVLDYNPEKAKELWAQADAISTW